MRLGGLGSRGGGRDLIDRTPKNIPLELGGFEVVRRKRLAPRPVRIWRRNSVTILTGAGLGAAVLGAWLAYTQPPVPVYLIGNTVRIADNSPLVAQGNVDAARVTYAGSGAAMVVVRDGQNTRGAAVAVAHGRHITGQCSMSMASDTSVTESCSFVIDYAHKLAATDTLDITQGSVWHRHYDDGSDTLIAVPPNGAVIPVPFAIGK